MDESKSVEVPHIREAGPNYGKTIIKKLLVSLSSIEWSSQVSTGREIFVNDSSRTRINRHQRLLCDPHKIAKRMPKRMSKRMPVRHTREKTGFDHAIGRRETNKIKTESAERFF